MAVFAHNVICDANLEHWCKYCKEKAAAKYVHLVHIFLKWKMNLILE